MKRLQSGFTVIEVLLILIIVGLIGGTGWYVWHANNNANKNLDIAANTSQNIPTAKAIKTFDDCMSKGGSEILAEGDYDVCQMPDGKKFTSTKKRTKLTYVTTTPDLMNGYFVIKEWGVRAKYGSSLKLEYAHETHDIAHGTLLFSSAQLVAKGSACKPENFPAGYIARYKSSEHVYNEAGDDLGETASQYAVDYTKLSGQPMAHIGDYYYFYHGPQAPCADPEVSSNKSTTQQTISAVQSVVTHLETAPAQ